ncbi:hypothetical protein S2M10_31580 [Sphingomonas sp. S2M10]|uniref:hypothetical protein n=1 Tax=Sphingomonas sp. S2M10 TaxID=2705010 RepID=UPI001456628F|nr:hypothetical protein [Sphingomonas sp. S2M10]NLS28149.1 hypothetical protein [Sphingomonas sp. S2M10]
MPNPIITDEQAAEMREQLAVYEREKAYQAALARHQVYLAVKPLVESEAFIGIHQQLADIRANGPKDDSFFGIGIEAVFQGMTGLGINVANWVEPVAPTSTTVPTAT